MPLYLQVKADPIVEAMWKLNEKNGSFTTQDLQNYIQDHGYEIPTMTLFHRLQTYTKKAIIYIAKGDKKVGTFSHYSISKKEFEKEIGKVV